MSEIKVTPRDTVRDSTNDNKINKNKSYYQIKYEPSVSSDGPTHPSYHLLATIDWEHNKFEIADDYSSRGLTDVEETNELAVKPCLCCGGHAHIKAESRPDFKIWCECDECHLQTQPWYPATDNSDNLLHNIERCKANVLKQWNQRV